MAKETPPPPIRHTFADKAPPTVEQFFERKLEGLPRTSIQEYQTLCNYQHRAMEHFRDEIAGRRDADIERLTRDILDQKLTENHLELRPKLSAQQSRRSLEVLAREEATVKVDMEGERRLSLADARHLEERYNKIGQLQLKEQYKRDFQASHGNAHTPTINTNDGNER